ncbi:hypothetical protein ACQRIU_004795 [Beauveria bassiana]
MKPVATLSNETTHKGRLSATIAEKRRLFEAEVPFLKELSGSRMPNTKSPKTATAMFLQEETSDKKLSLSHSCGTMYTVPKTAPNSPTKPNFGVCSLQHSHSQRHDKTQNPSIHSVPASSFVLRVHRVPRTIEAAESLIPTLVFAQLGGLGIASALSTGAA